MKVDRITLFTLLISVVFALSVCASEGPTGVTATDEDHGRIDYLLDRSALLERQGLNDLAVRELNGLIPLVKEKGTFRQQAVALNRLGSLLTPYPFPVDEGSMATNKMVRSLKITPLDKAKGCLVEALALSRKDGDRAMEASVLNNLGTLNWTRKQYDQATPLYEESIRLARASGNQSLLGAALTNLGRLQVSCAFYAAADNSLQEAYKLWTGLPDATDKVEALINLGLSFSRLASGDVNAAARHRSLAAKVFAEAAQSAERLSDARLTSSALGYQGRVSEDCGDTDGALSLTRRALFHAQIINSPELLCHWQWQLGRILQRRGEKSAAISAYIMAVRALQSVRQSVRRYSAAAFSFKEMVEPVYLSLTDLLLQEAKTASDPESRARLLYAVMMTTENLRTAELQDYFKDSCLGSQIRRELTAGTSARTAVLYLISMPDRLELLLNLPSGIRSVTSAFGAETVAVQARTLARQLSAVSDDYLASAGKLYDMIIRPIEAELVREKIEHLVIVPDGVVRTIPLAALHDGKEFLVYKYTISTTQGLLLVNPSPPAVQPSRQVLMAGISESVRGFPALPSVRSELGGIASMYGGKTLLDNDFVMASLKNEIEKTPYSYIHLATHGEFAGDVHNMFILAWDGLITADNLNRYISPTKYRSEPIELLTLSACKTAVGDDRAALGLAGIAVKAGAKSTVATLWEINDKVTSELIQEFYRNLSKQGMTKAAALQQAQLKIMQEHRHPYFWAPFLLIGNWL